MPGTAVLSLSGVQKAVTMEAARWQGLCIMGGCACLPGAQQCSCTPLELHGKPDGSRLHRQLTHGAHLQAITGGKRVRAETSIASGAVSVSSAAAELALLKLPGGILRGHLGVHCGCGEDEPAAAQAPCLQGLQVGGLQPGRARMVPRVPESLLHACSMKHAACEPQVPAQAARLQRLQVGKDRGEGYLHLVQPEGPPACLGSSGVSN